MSVKNCISVRDLPYPICFGRNSWDIFGALIRSQFPSSRIFLLTDRNVSEQCLEMLMDKAPYLRTCPVKAVDPGEASKDIGTAVECWDWLTGLKAGRNDLLVNFGGGVVTDLGGFVASNYKRGMVFLNVPTTLIGQADAAIGGKTGINFNGIKNQLGMFRDPAAVFIDPGFLASLPERQLHSGYGELIKSALLTGGKFWEDVRKRSFWDMPALESFILCSVRHKAEVVSRDPYDLHERKSLNFGHTLGHALEGFYMEEGKEPLLHGEAVAAGLICEGYMSCKFTGLSTEVLKEIVGLVQRYFPSLLNRLISNDLSRYLEQDKKNRGEGLRITLLNAPGEPVVDFPIRIEDALESVNQTNSLSIAARLKLI